MERKCCWTPPATVARIGRLHLGELDRALSPSGSDRDDRNVANARERARAGATWPPGCSSSSSDGTFARNTPVFCVHGGALQGRLPSSRWHVMAGITPPVQQLEVAAARYQLGRGRARRCETSALRCCRTVTTPPLGW